MNYLTRPVFEFAVNGEATPIKSFSYDLREFQIGFGRKKAAPIQSHVAQGVEFSVELTTAADITAWDNFFAAVKGRLAGFWFPSVVDAVKIVDGVSATQFDIEAQDFAANFSEHPDQYLYFSKDGEAAKIAKITGVVGIGSIERVTINANHAIDETWTAARLHYVRLAGDEEPVEIAAEVSRQSRTVRFVELPTEYAAFEAGIEKIYLYHFWLDTVTPIHWRYTSFDEDILSNGQPFLTSAINHGQLRESIKGDREEVTIEAFYEPGHPLSLFTPRPLAKPMWVEIRETTLGAPNVTTVLFTGFVLEAPSEGEKLKARCGSEIDVLGQKILSMVFQSRCNYSLFSPPCGLLKAAFAIDVTITRISGNALELTGAGLADKPEDWFSLGFIETGDGGTFDLINVTKSLAAVGNTIQVFLDDNLTWAALNDAAVIYPGCDGLSATCQSAKFNNFSRWGGHRGSNVNSVIKGIEVTNDNPNKK